MGNFWFGFSALWRVWTDGAFAEKVRSLTKEGEAVSKPAGEEAKAPAQRPAAAPVAPTPVSAPAPTPALAKAPARSEALTLLSVLQREGRLIDFLKEPITGYTDAQIGAAVRGIHEDCGKALERLFALEPLRPESEGAQVSVPAGYDPGEVRLVGSVPEAGPFKGTLQHPGWRATKAALPEWNGREESAMVVAPCEIEIK